jgi:TadE-like protein
MSATSRASPRHDRGRHSDSGMVTVEAAIALCAFVTVLAMVLGGVSMVLDQIRCTDAAREAARLVARGEQNRAADAVNQIAAGATLSITTVGDAITVGVIDPAIGGLLPGVHIHAEAYAVREPDADTPPAIPDNSQSPATASQDSSNGHGPTEAGHGTGGQTGARPGGHDSDVDGHDQRDDPAHGRAPAYGYAPAGGRVPNSRAAAGPSGSRRPTEGDRR